MPKLTILVGPPGSGKSTYAQHWLNELPASSDMTKKLVISQDRDGKDHLKYFNDAIKGIGTYDILVDRMGFNKQQRDRYLNPAKERGYQTEIIVLHESQETCLKRCVARIGNHETIHTEQNARDALKTFFGKYERPLLNEADTVEYRYPKIGMQLNAVLVDIDGTAANIDQRLHFMDGPKKNWPKFFEDMVNDKPNVWCQTLVRALKPSHSIVFLSGRPDNFRAITSKWLEDNKYSKDELFMRPRYDSRSDEIVKEILLDFEVLTRYNSILFAVDDRPRVCRMWRERGLTVLQCNDKEF